MWKLTFKIFIKSLRFETPKYNIIIFTRAIIFTKLFIIIY